MFGMSPDAGRPMEIEIESYLAVLPSIPPVTLSDAFWLFVCLAWLCYCLVCSCGQQDDNDSFRSFDCNQWCGNNDYAWRSDYDYDYDWHDDWSYDESNEGEDNR